MHVLSHRQRRTRAVPVHRQEVHRRPQRPCANAVTVQRREQPVALGGVFAVEHERIEPVVALRARRLTIDARPGKIPEGMQIALGEHTLGLDHRRQPLHLRAAKRRIDVRKAVIVGDLVMVECPGVRLLRRGGEVPRVTGMRLIVGHDHAATAGRDDLVAVEAEHGGMAERAAALPVPGSSRATRSRPRRPRDRIWRPPRRAAAMSTGCPKMCTGTTARSRRPVCLFTHAPFRRTAMAVEMRLECLRIEPQRVPGRIRRNAGSRRHG